MYDDYEFYQEQESPFEVQVENLLFTAELQAQKDPVGSLVLYRQIISKQVQQSQNFKTLEAIQKSLDIMLKADDYKATNDLVMFALTKSLPILPKTKGSLLLQSMSNKIYQVGEHDDMLPCKALLLDHTKSNKQVYLKLSLKELSRLKKKNLKQQTIKLIKSIRDSLPADSLNNFNQIMLLQHAAWAAPLTKKQIRTALKLLDVTAVCAPCLKYLIAQNQTMLQNYKNAQKWYLNAFKDMVQSSDTAARQCLGWLIVTISLHESSLQLFSLAEARLFINDQHIQDLNKITTFIKENDVRGFKQCSHSVSGFPYSGLLQQKGKTHQSIRKYGLMRQGNFTNNQERIQFLRLAGQKKIEGNTGIANTWTRQIKL